MKRSANDANRHDDYAKQVRWLSVVSACGASRGCIACMRFCASSMGEMRVLKIWEPLN